MSILSVHGLVKHFGPQVVLDEASLSIEAGERVGLVGANGSGKSTLAAILAGKEQSDLGKLTLRRDLTVSYLDQEPHLDPEKTALEITLTGLTRFQAAAARYEELTQLLTDGEGDLDALSDELVKLAEEIELLGGHNQEHRCEEMLEKLGVADPRRVVAGRSGGELRRIALARLLLSSPDFALLDEPTNHLDVDVSAWLEDYLATSFHGAILLVTHDRYFLESVCTRIVELERGKLQSYSGNYSAYLSKKAELLAQEDRVEQRRQNLLRIEKEWLSRGPKARSTKQKARIQRAEELQARGPANAGRPGVVDLSSAVADVRRAGKTILELRNVSLGIADRTLTEPFDLFVTEGDRIGILGINGIGKTTLLKTILGEVKPKSGEVVLGRGTRIGLLDQHRRNLTDNNSIFDEVRGDGGTNIELSPGNAMDLRSYLELFLFDSGKQRQKVGALSGGERARVCLAKLLKQGANLLLLDEPTNDLDLATLGALEQLLIELPVSLLVITHDRAFLDRVPTSVLAFERQTSGLATIERHGGGYSDYRAHLLERNQQKSVKSAPPRPKADSLAPEKIETPKAKAPAKSGTLSFAEKKELGGLLDRIAEAETELSALEHKLADRATYEKAPGAPGSSLTPSALTLKRAELTEKVAKLTARWEELEQKNG